MLPPKPNFWQQFLENFNPNQIAQGAMMGMQEKRQREGVAAKVLQAVAENQIPLELIGTPEGQAMIKNLKIENMPGIQDLLSQARSAATMRFPERQVTAPPAGTAGQPEPGPPVATPQLAGGPPTGPAMSIPPGQRPMTLPEAQVSAAQREFGIKMGQKEYENAMETRKYETQKQIDLFYKQLGEKTPQRTVAWIRETMDVAKAAGLDVEGINYEGVTAAGPYREEGRGLEKQRLSDEQYRSYQTAVKDAVNFKFAGAKYLADLRTGKQGLMGNLINMFSAGSDVEAVSQGQYIADPQKRYQFMFSMINRGIADHNKVVSDTEKQYRIRPTKPIEPINDKLLGELANVEAKTGKSFSDFVSGLGLGKLFDKAKAAVAQVPKTLDQSGAAQKAAEYAAFRAKYPNEPEALVKMAWQKYLASIGK
jgi:hypothetical protein